MSDFDLTIDDENKLIRVTADGLFFKTDVARMVGTARDQAIKLGFNLFYDVQNAERRLSAFDWYELPRELEAYNHPTARLIKAAAVLSQKADFRDLRFFETVLQNLGFNVRLFLSYDYALDWVLRGTEPEGGADTILQGWF